MFENFALILEVQKYFSLRHLVYHLLQSMKHTLNTILLMEVATRISLDWYLTGSLLKGKRHGLNKLV